MPNHGYIGAEIEVFYNAEKNHTYYLKLTNENFIKMNKKEFNEFLEDI